MTAGRAAVTAKKDWGTPEVYVSAVKRMFGGSISLDPCSGPHSIIGAETEWMPPEYDGLNAEWDYPNIYVNPPYGADRGSGTRIIDWLRKCADAYDAYGSEVLALVPVATNTAHWKRYVFGRATAVCFLYDTRLRFLVDGRRGGKGAPMACAMLYYGGRYGRFREVFCGYGAVVDVREAGGRAAAA